MFFLDSSNICQLGYIFIDLYRKSIWNKCCTLVIAHIRPIGTGIFTYAFTIHLGEHVGTTEKQHGYQTSMVWKMYLLSNMAIFWYLYEPRKIPWLVGLYRGLYYPYYRDCSKTILRIPINQPGFNGK